MPVSQDDPSVLTKERLKSELRAHNVELPGGNPTKDVYVQLYVKAVSAQSHGTDPLDAFSSDEELPPPAGPQTRRSRSSGPKSGAALERLDVALMSDEDLREQLLTQGVHAGPIVASTRKLYEKKLLKLLDNGAVLSESQSHSGGGEANAEVYSDQEEEAPAAPEPERGAAPELETVPVKSSSLWPPSAQRRSSSQCSVTTVEQGEKKTAEPPSSQEDTDVPELPDVHTFTGLTASCRRPIKGSARHPVVRDHNFESKGGVCNSAPTTTSSTNPGPSSASSAPSSACQAEARSMCGWKKLLLLFVLGAFVFLVYQVMEPNAAVPFGQVEEL